MCFVKQKTAYEMRISDWSSDVFSSDLILGYFGNMVTRKRPLLFVETIAAINRRRPNNPAIGLLFGSPLEDGLDQAVIARAAELGVSDLIRMIGFRHPSEPWMAACDALLVPAVAEPFGRTLIEEMVLETSVIAANSGGTPARGA